MANDGWKFFRGVFGGGNYAKDFDGFYVSYNPSACSDIAIFAGDGDGEETALVHEGKFYILNGDFRADYERLAPDGFAGCLQFFRDNADRKSSWSDAAPVAA